MQRGRSTGNAEKVVTNVLIYIGLKVLRANVLAEF
jgi:hypothetical protein